MGAFYKIENDNYYRTTAYLSHSKVTYYIKRENGGWLVYRSIGLGAKRGILGKSFKTLNAAKARVLFFLERRRKWEAIILASSRVKDKFKKLLIQSRELPIDWEKRRVLAEKTGEVDYDCQFNSEGLCKIQKSNNQSSRMCCCSWCSGSYGYFSRLIDPESYSFLVENYSPKEGFWREGVGCIIPRKWRSETCLGYNCLPYTREKDIVRAQIKTLAGYPTTPISLSNVLNYFEHWDWGDQATRISDGVKVKIAKVRPLLDESGLVSLITEDGVVEFGDPKDLLVNLHI